MWYTKVIQDLSSIPHFIDYYNKQLDEAKLEVILNGHVETNIKELPGVTEQRFYQLQEIEAVLEFLNIELRRIRRKYFKQYLEAYARSLSSRDAEKYADGEDEVIDFELLINEVALLRNRWLGIMKGLDTKQWQLGHIVKLRTAGMEDVVV
jgi:uncharacterized protein YfdQ (DUF2303 family)